MIRPSLLFLSLSFLTGEPTNPINDSYKNYPEGPYKEYYTDGQLRLSFTIVNSNLHGEFAYYQRNGKLIELNHYEHGRFIDTNKRYNSDGTLSIIEAFRRDTMLFHKQLQYHKNGAIKNERYLTCYTDSLRMWPFANAKSGLRSINYDINKSFEHIPCRGEDIDYYPDGSVEARYALVNNELEGPFTTYYKNGDLYSQGTCHNNTWDGVITYYSPDGNVLRTETWKQGKKISASSR